MECAHPRKFSLINIKIPKLLLACMPRYVTIDLFGKVQVGKTTIFNHFVDPQYRHLDQGGNLSYDFRTYYARCWVLPHRWSHSMIFLADPKFDMKWQSLDIKFLTKMFEPTNILMVVNDSTPEDVECVKHGFTVFPRIKRNLIVFVIANMQDKAGALSVENIIQRLEINDVLGLNALETSTKSKVEPFLEKAVYRYFHMLSKRGEEMELINDHEDFGVPKPEIEPSKASGKYMDRLLKANKKKSE
jgi:hypothetical protein